jgi:hypothetical protein
MEDGLGLRVTLAFARGKGIERTWTWRELREDRIPEWLHGDPPSWLRAPEVTLERNPVIIAFSANVPEGLEEDARALLAMPSHRAPRAA